MSFIVNWPGSIGSVVNNSKKKTAKLEQEISSTATSSKGLKAKTKSKSNTADSINKWNQNRRLEFIEFRINFDGRLNRRDLVQFFGISVPQASLDICQYRKLVKKVDPSRQNFYYDCHQKVYLKADDFEPIFEAQSTPLHYLNDLLALSGGNLPDSRNFFGFVPNVGIASFNPPERIINAEFLGNILEAIRYRYAIHISYMSVSSNKNKDYLIVPHGLAYDGLRWHMRAYSYDDHAFRDFVLSRLTYCTEPEIPAPNDRFIDPETGSFKEVGTLGNDDVEWNELIDLVLQANPALKPGARRAIELDYGMKENGTMVYTCRRALVFYTLQWLRLTSEFDGLPPTYRQLVLVNADEVNRRMNGGH